MSTSSAVPGSVTAALFSPIHELLPQCENLRDCPELPDAAWIRLGLERALHELPSGRAFLQEHAYAMAHCPPRANYFASLKSARRLSLARELNQRICSRVAQAVSDPLAQYPDLAAFDVYAGDGHWHGAAAHDLPLDGLKRAVGHFYALDLRHHSLRHLGVGIGKKEHDMHVLKRLDIQLLRQFAPTGRKVLYVWDKAGIDFRAWHTWKQASGVYFVSMEKENMKLEGMGLADWDRNDPLNAGIQSVELVAGSAGVMVRRIRYVKPVTGNQYIFITNEMTLRHGLIAFLYKLRWDVEKVFDVLKNKLNEQQAWATTDTAKSVQAQLICLLHNLLQILQERLREEGIENEAEKQRRRETLERVQALATAAGRVIPSCVVALQRLTQCSVKLLRWLRSSLRDRLPWSAATARLRVLYATL